MTPPLGARAPAHDSECYTPTLRSAMRHNFADKRGLRLPSVRPNHLAAQQYVVFFTQPRSQPKTKRTDETDVAQLATLPTTAARKKILQLASNTCLKQTRGRALSRTVTQSIMASIMAKLADNTGRIKKNPDTCHVHLQPVRTLATETEGPCWHPTLQLFRHANSLP
jgi:hypothetical protein